MARVKETESRKAKTTSKLVARLREISRGQVTPLGFARVVVSDLPAMLLLAEVDAADSASIKSAVEAGADGLVLRVESGDAAEARSAVESAAKASGDKTVSVLLSGDKAWSADEVDALAAAGADCFIARPSRAPASLLKLESLGHIALVDGDLTKFPVRGLNEQHVDVILLHMERPEGSPAGVTVQDVAAWRSALEAFRRPVVLPVPAGLVPSDLEFVREAGAEAILVPVEPKGGAALGDLRKAIDALGPPVGRGRGTEGRQVFLPHVQASPESEDDEDDE